MSGAEDAGLALGVLPMTFVAVDKYEMMLASLPRYRHYSSKVDKLVMELEIQRIIYQTECVPLLATVVPGDTARAMLNDTKHSTWRYQQLDARLAWHFQHESVGNLDKACRSAIRAIRNTVEVLSSKVNKLLGAISASPGSNHSWRRALRTKLKFSLSGTDLTRLMAKVEEPQ